MIRGDELARLIQASLPLPGGNVARTKSVAAHATSLADHNAAGRNTNDHVSAGDPPAWALDWSRVSLKRTLLNQVLASSLPDTADDARAPRDAGQPYVNNFADDIAGVDHDARSAIETQSRLAPDHAAPFNPALSIVAAELTKSRSLMATALIPPSDRASALRPAETVQTKPAGRPKRDANRLLAWLYAGATIALAIAVVAAA